MMVWANLQEINSWFVGFLEGEGCATGNGVTQTIEIDNTDKELIQFCIDYLNELFIKHSTTDIIDRRQKHYKPIHRINVSSKIECDILIEMLGDAFQCRKQEFLNKLRLSSSQTIRGDSSEIGIDFPTPDLYWLIGFIEAEGSFNISRTYKQKYVPDISVQNTRQPLMQKLANTLKSMDCSWHSSNRLRGDNPNWSRVYHIQIRGMLRSRRFLLKTKDLYRSKYYRERELIYFFSS